MKIHAMFAAALLICAPAVFADSAAATSPTPKPDAGVPSKHCLRDTGSRLPRKSDDCVAANGDVLTREDLQQTGSINTADAIRRLSPSMH